jgi:hypothetical protein
MFSFILKLVFIGLGIYFLFGPHVLDRISEQTQRIFGGLLIGYGTFRAWMTWRQIVRDNKRLSHGNEQDN